MLQKDNDNETDIRKMGNVNWRQVAQDRNGGEQLGRGLSFLEEEEKDEEKEEEDEEKEEEEEDKGEEKEEEEKEDEEKKKKQEEEEKKKKEEEEEEKKKKKKEEKKKREKKDNDTKIRKRLKGTCSTKWKLLNSRIPASEATGQTS